MSRFPSGARLRSARVQAGLSVEQVAVAINRSAFSVHSYEMGRVEPPVHVLKGIADACGTTVGRLLGEPVPA